MSSDGNATSLSNTSTAVARLGERRVAQHLAVLVDAHDPALGRDRVHDPDAVIVQQRVELLPERAEPAGLHLDQLPVRADQVDHERPTGTSRDGRPAPRATPSRQHERALAHHPDVGHERTG